MPKTYAWNGFSTKVSIFWFLLKETPDWFKPLSCLYYGAGKISDELRDDKYQFRQLNNVHRFWLPYKRDLFVRRVKMMEYSNHRYAVVSEANPESALYFENAYSLFGGVYGTLSGASDIFQIQNPNKINDFVLNSEIVLGEEHFTTKTAITNAALEIMKRNFILNEQTRSFLPKIEKFIIDYGQDSYGNRDSVISLFIENCAVITDDPIDANGFINNLMIAATTAHLRSRGHYAVPIFENINSPNWVQGNNLSDGVELALLDLPIVDGTGCSWEQAKEIRSDKDSSRQLRNLRLFLDGIDKNKGKDHLQDMLLTRVDDYSDAIKKHGLTTKNQLIKAFIGMEHIPKLVACGLFALIDPGLNSVDALAGMLAATEVKGAFQELGGVGMSLKEAQLTRGLGSEYQEVEYLMSIKNKLTGST